jgi:hypothetical protein
MKMLNQFILQLNLLLLLFLPCSVLAEETLQFAGFAFLGESADDEKNYPHSLKISNPYQGNEGTPLDAALRFPLDAALRNKLKAEELRFGINTSDSADLKSGNTLSLAFALDRETVFHERVCDGNKLVIELSAQALLVDFENLEPSIIGSYPMIVQYIDRPKNPPTDEYIRGLIKKLYLGGLSVNIFDEFIRVVSTVEIKRKYGLRIKVTDVEVKEEALPYLPEQFSGPNLDNFRIYVAQSFSSALSTNQRVSVLPYTEGGAIANKMAARFSNGDVYNLLIPKTDFSIKLTVSGFKKVLFDKNAIGESWVYGVYVEPKVFEKLSGDVLFEHPVKNGATKKVLSCQTDIDDWPAYQETMLVLYDEFTKQISAQEKDWSKTHMGDKAMVKELKELEGAISKCR